MKVAVVTDYNNKTGIGSQNYNLYIGLKRLGADVDIINLVSPQGFKSIPEYGINIISSIFNNIYLSFAYGIFSKFPRSLKKTLHARKYDVVILGHQGLAYLYRPLSGLSSKMIIITHDLFSLYKGVYGGLDYVIYNHFLLPRLPDFKNIVFISDFTKNDYHKYYDHLDEKNYRKIYQGIDKINISNEIKNKLISRFKLGGKRLVLNVGSEDKRKNIKTFLAIANHYKHNENIVFVRVGKKTTESEDYIAKHKLENIIYLGGLSEEELMGLYAISNIVVSTSLLEGYGRQIFEGYLYENFIVTTRVSDIESIFRGDGNVFIVNESKNIKEYVGYIDRIFEKKLVFGGNTTIQSLNHEAEEYIEYIKNMIPKVQYTNK